MRFIIVLALVAVALARPDDSHYDEKYDNFNIDEIIGNDRLLKAYTHCFIGDGKCTAEGHDFKKWLPEGTQSSCSKCTPKQKILVAKFIKAIQEKLHAEYDILIKQLDPEGKHGDQLKEFVEKYGS